MAIAIAKYSVDMTSSDIVWYGTVSIANSSQIQIVDSGYSQNYFGSFYYNGDVVYGIVSSTNYYVNGKQIYSISGLSANANTIYNYFNINDSTGLLKYIFSGDDTLTGSSYNDKLLSFAGNDTLNGGAGADILKGGTGNDIYIVDNASDIVTELVSEGTDTVKSSVSYTLTSNIENLTLSGYFNVNGTGNELNNIIIGTSYDNILKGGLGVDTLNGLAGNDTLDGESGADLMIGGLGNDTYYIDNIGDKITELTSQGTDKINSQISYTLTSNVEKLTLLGTNSINGTGNILNNVIIGNQANNKLNGDIGNDTLSGHDGNDVLDGGAGADNMTGGNGNDIYYVDNVKDKITEYWTTTGMDSVFSSVSYSLSGILDMSISMGTSSLASSIENLTLIGNTAKTALGNALNNTISGNSADNFLNGLDGSDTYTGGLGKDIFVLNKYSNTIDKIKDFNITDDTIYIVNETSSLTSKIAGISTTAKVLNKDYFKANIDGLAKDSNDYLVYETDTGKLFYDADGSGYGKSIQIALIENKAALTYADFTVI